MDMENQGYLLGEVESVFYSTDQSYCTRGNKRGRVNVGVISYFGEG